MFDSSSLAGVHIVSLATNLPGPLAARQLRRLGASVTKVEPPSGDPVSAFPAWYAALTTGQTITVLDLKSARDRRAFLALLCDAELLLSAMRPAAAARLGLSELVAQAQVAHVEIVGDLAQPAAPGHDLTYQAAAGVLNPPEMPRVPWADVAGGYQATIAALDALRARDRASAAGLNRAVHRRVGLKQGVDEAAEALHIGAATPGQALSGSHPAYGIYRTQDGWIAVAALEPHFQATFTTLLGTDRATIAEAFAGRSTQAWLELAHEHDLPCTAVTGPQVQDSTDAD